MITQSDTRWSESWAIATWSIGSSLITIGATVRDALLVVLFANVLTAAVIVLNGRAASVYHIGYPVLARSVFGIYGQYFVIVLRSILGIVWGRLFSSLDACGWCVSADRMQEASSSITKVNLSPSVCARFSQVGGRFRMGFPRCAIAR